MGITNPFCLLVRGKPCSGKTTIITDLKRIFNNFTLLDPDFINKRTKHYKQFSPRKTRNPSENVKMYCYLYDLAESKLKLGKNIIWAQPWSRHAEVELTIRNFFYYLTDLKEASWTQEINKIIKLLPFKLLIAEIEISNDIAIARWTNKNFKHSEQELERLKKH